MTIQHDERRKPKKLYVLGAVLTFLTICFSAGWRASYTRTVTATIGIAGIQSSSDANKVQVMLLKSFPEMRGFHFGRKAGTDEWITQCTFKVASETHWQDSVHSLLKIVEPPLKARVISANYVSFGIPRPGKGDFVFGRQEWNADTD